MPTGIGAGELPAGRMDPLAADAAAGTPASLVNSRTVKSCCATFYASEAARLLLGGSLHPGGDRPTLRLGRELGLGPNDRVLELACGNGRSALLLAGEFGCSVVGVDYSRDNILAARQAARAAGLERRVAFFQGDAETLALAAGSFDALVCECAFCTFPDKTAAAGEMRRALVPGGRLGLSDVTLEQPLPAELETLAAWVLCIADARPAEDYRAILSAAGLQPGMSAQASWTLREVLDSVGIRLMALEAAQKLGALPPTGWDFAAARGLLRRTKEFTESGGAGYVLLTARAGG